MGNTNQKVWTTEDVATYIGLSDQTVRKMAKSGELPHVKIRRKFYFTPEVIKRIFNHGHESETV